MGTTSGTANEMGSSDVSPTDEQLMSEFMKFLQDHPEMLQGSDAPIPILFFVLAASSTLLVRPLSRKSFSIADYDCLTDI